MDCEEICYDPSFLKQRLFKIQDENLKLKSDLLNIESEVKPKLNNLEEELYRYKNENTNLNFEINMRDEKITELMNKIMLLDNCNQESCEKIKKMENDYFNLKEKYSNLYKEIQVNKNINDQMRIDNKSLIDIIKEDNSKINNLKKENYMLICQLQELQNNLNNVITPKLKKNEEHLINLQDEINQLLCENSNLKEDNITLCNQNEKQCELISNLKNKIRTYIDEGQTFFNKDLKFFDDAEIPLKRRQNNDNYVNYLYTEPLNEKYSNKEKILMTENKSTYQSTNDDKNKRNYN